MRPRSEGEILCRAPGNTAGVKPPIQVARPPLFSQRVGSGLIPRGSIEAIANLLDGEDSCSAFGESGPILANTSAA